MANLINIIFSGHKTSIRILGEKFVKNNKNICKIIYDNKIYDLTERLKIENKEKIKIKLIGINNITNMSCIFAKCEDLIELPNISKWNTINVIDMSKMFYNCSSLSSLPDISKWNTNNVENMSEMFSGCLSLLFN